MLLQKRAVSDEYTLSEAVPGSLLEQQDELSTPALQQLR